MREGVPARPENKEHQPELVGKITLFRHGDTAYSEVYPDLTDEGKRKLLEAGVSLKDVVDEDGEDLLFFYSPTVRAKASMGYLLQGLGKGLGTEEADVEAQAQPIDKLRSARKHNPEEVQKLISKHTVTEDPDDPAFAEFDRVYALHEDFETTPHMEARSSVERRGRGLLRQAVKLLLRKPGSEPDKIPHIVAVTHFELLNGLAVELFGLDLEHDPLYARGEKMTIEVRRTNGQATPTLIFGFRGHYQSVSFDTRTSEFARV